MGHGVHGLTRSVNEGDAGKVRAAKSHTVWGEGVCPTCTTFYTLVI